jgi:UDP-N-acetylmuramate dehydrogenase
MFRSKGAEMDLRSACGDRLKVQFPLAPLTSFRIGGPAALYLEPESEADLEAVSDAVRKWDIPFAILGKGSNVIISDDGFDGLVLRLGRAFRWVAREGEDLTAGGAMPLPALSGVAAGHGLGGFAFAVAIPASLGGAVKMNAGAHSGQMSDVVERAEVLSLSHGDRRWISASELGFGYRASSLPADAIVLTACLHLHPQDREQIRTEMQEARDWRKRTQPLAEPNCGSVFVNPPGDHAARLIEEAGMKGRSIGGARVSEKHANFIVTEPDAKAADVARLIEEIQEKVRTRFGRELQTEVRFIGRRADA